VRADHMFKVIDIHSAGAPSRLILSGVPHLAGATTMEKMQHFATHYDWIRRSLSPAGGGEEMVSRTLRATARAFWCRIRQ
jgi:proline racemase